MQTTLGTAETFDSRTDSVGPNVEFIRLSLVHHPDGRRIGRAIALTKGETTLARSVPDFGDGPLGLRALSRAPVTLTVTASQTLVIDPTATRTQVRIDGVDLSGPVRLPAARLRSGVSLTLGRRVVLWARLVTATRGPEVPGIVGHSDVIEALRGEIARVAAFDLPCLIVGETGAGKELVARGIHALSSRISRPFVALNMAALPPTVAPSQLFGHAKGAFTGAERDAPGAFVTADRGTLFLDEIGACPSAVQAQLLRALETGSVHPVGAAQSRVVDVRVVAATDAALEAQGEAGTFRAPLLHRLSGYVIRVPTLAARRGDIPVLFHHFLKEILEKAGEAGRLIDAERPWVPTRLIEKLLQASWPGNVRALRNMAQTVAVRGAGRDQLSADLLDDRLTAASTASDASTGYRAGREISEDALLAALAAHRYRIAPTAKALNVSRTALYARIGLSSRVRTAAGLTAAEIQAAFGTTPDLAGAAQRLGVSAHALKLRIRALDLSV